MPPFPRLQEHLARQGYVLVRTTGADDDVIAMIRRLGRFVPQSDGELVRTVEAVSAHENRYDSRSTGAILPHTECFAQEGLPPRYIALWCRATPEFGGQTLLADGHAFFASLAPADQSLILRVPVGFGSYRSQGNDRISVRKPLFERTEDGRLLLRFSSTGLRPPDDPGLLSVVDRLRRFCDRTRVEVDWTPGDLLILDNHRMLHGRRAFEGRRRQLRRVWIEA